MANNLLQQQLANQAYNAQYNQNQGWVPYQHIGAGTGTLSPYPYGGFLAQVGSGPAQQLDPYVPYVTIDTRVEFSEEEIMRAEQIMEECENGTNR